MKSKIDSVDSISHKKIVSFLEEQFIFKYVFYHASSYWQVSWKHLFQIDDDLYNVLYIYLKDIPSRKLENFENS